MALKPSGPEIGVKYTLTGPDGAEATFNEPSDPNFVGYLTEVTGLESPEVRENAENTAGQDGGTHGEFWYGRRPITLQGQIINVTSNEDRNKKQTKLQQASNAMREDAVLEWTPSGGEPQFVKVRRAQPLRITGGYTKDFSLSLVSADPRIYSKALTTAEVELKSEIAGTSGVTPVSSVRIEEFLYVVNKGANTVTVFEISPNEKRIFLVESKATGVGPWGITGDSKNVYVTNNGANTVSKYTRNSTTGKLTLIGTVLTGEEPRGIDCTQTVLLVTNFKSGSISCFERNFSTGELTLKETKTEAGITDGAIAVVMASSSKAVIASNTKNLLAEYTVTESAVLTKVKSLATVTAPVFLAKFSRTLVVPPKVTTTYYIAVVGTTAMTLYQSLLAGTILNTEEKITGAGTKLSSASVLIAGSELFVYITDETANLITVYSRPVTGGTLTSIGTASAVEKPVAISVNAHEAWVVLGTKSIFRYERIESGPSEGLLYEGLQGVVCTNNGDMEMPPILTIANKNTSTNLVAPAVVNTTTGEIISFPNLELAPSDSLQIDMLKRTATVNGVSVFATLDLAASTWWQLAPGANEVKPAAGSHPTTAKLIVEYRSAWV